ncbi:Uncharacterised protein [Mycobacteroides abscessus subsp. abscessus]|nr:Uncharacterised protein [Mycobacteroides abscessus subsp. abscessus]SLB68366.1 Uncharacterised protein [Mycobacteroides abscessus subsp. abscessus]
MTTIYPRSGVQTPTIAYTQHRLHPALAEYIGRR